MSRLVWVLLFVVAAAAAVLSFDALRSLALLCGFIAELPVVVDAGARVGCLVWLGRSTPPDAASFARTLTWSLLAGSVVGNAPVHGLTAYGLPAPWWLVVAVSAHGRPGKTTRGGARITGHVNRPRRRRGRESGAERSGVVARELGYRPRFASGQHPNDVGRGRRRATSQLLPKDHQLVGQPRR